jgi:hypothetical protein
MADWLQRRQTALPEQRRLQLAELAATLARHLADIGSDDDAAVLARRPASPRQPIHWTEYRIGMYGADGEWRIERRLEGVQAVPGQTWHIRCTAAESEFRHYRYLLEGICLSFVPPKR